MVQGVCLSSAAGLDNVVALGNRFRPERAGDVQWREQLTFFLLFFSVAVKNAVYLICH